MSTPDLNLKYWTLMRIFGPFFVVAVIYFVYNMMVMTRLWLWRRNRMHLWWWGALLSTYIQPTTYHYHIFIPGFCRRCTCRGSRFHALCQVCRPLFVFGSLFIIIILYNGVWLWVFWKFPSHVHFMCVWLRGLNLWCAHISTWWQWLIMMKNTHSNVNTVNGDAARRMWT